MYRIFVVEDDRTIAREVCRLAESWGMEAKSAEDIRNVAAEAAEYGPHLIIMDIGLPFFDGYYWCRELRKQTAAPILFLSSAADNMSVIMAVNMGGDDFVAKPFDGGVLMAKVRSLLRRCYDMASEPVLECRGARLHSGDQKLDYNGQTVELTKNEYRILQVLMENKAAMLVRLRETLHCMVEIDRAQSHNSGHEHGQYAVDLFHLVFSFISIFLQK